MIPGRICGGGWLRTRRSGFDLAQFEEFEAEGLDLGEDAEHRGLIFKRAGEALERQCLVACGTARL
ncbi:MAG: hypothetical protein QOE89_964 [Pseudonocardiales bacterium]|nr:hypothetical protein [Pseudonocardiales bacterium]